MSRAWPSITQGDRGILLNIETKKWSGRFSTYHVVVHVVPRGMTFWMVRRPVAYLRGGIGRCPPPLEPTLIFEQFFDSSFA